MTSLRGGRSDPNDHSNYSDQEIEERSKQVTSIVSLEEAMDDILSPIVSDTHLEDMKRWKQEYEDKRQVVYNHPIPPFEFKEETVTTQELEILPLWVMNLNIRGDNIRLNIEHETFHDFEGFEVEDIKAIMEIYL
jgi:hypothetical protein